MRGLGLSGGVFGSWEPRVEGAKHYVVYLKGFRFRMPCSLNHIG